ncbi:MAG: hypothetical protein HYZ22_01255, partial [Chloroflexi bacterium]|nr:hypothetical protein [Chloroflexota bacterium]
MNFDYGNILTRAFQITWKYKSFWLFMMFPMLVGSIIFLAFIVPVFFLEDDEEMMGLVMVFWLGVIALGMIASLLVSTAGMTSLTLGVLRAERGEGSTAFMDLVRDGFTYFGRALGAVLIIQLSIGAVFTAFFLCVGVLTVVTMGIASICLQPIMLLLTPLSFLVMAVMYGALVAVIDEDLGAWDAVKRAIVIVRENMWKFVIITLIVYFGTTFVTSILIFPMMMPIMGVPFLMESNVDINGQMIALIVIPFIC